MLKQIADGVRLEDRVAVAAAPENCLELCQEALGSKAFIASHFAERLEAFWGEFSRAGMAEKYRLGHAIADLETLKHSGAGQLLEIINSSCTEFGKASLFATTNLPRDPRAKALRRAALKELSDSPHIREFIDEITADMTEFTACFDRATCDPLLVNQNVILNLAKSTMHLKATLNSAPQIKSELLNALLEQLSDNINCEFFGSLQNIEKKNFSRLIEIDHKRIRIPPASHNQDRLLGGIAAAVAPASLVGGVCYWANVLGTGPASLWTTAALALAAALASIHLFKVAAPQAEKFGQTFIDSKDDGAYQALCSATGLLDELRALAELKVRFPAVTSYSNTAKANVISIDQMRHPLMCLQVGDSVPSNFRLAAGEPLLAGGQNGGGKTFFDQAIIQNYVLDEIDAVVFGLNVTMPRINGAMMHVPEQSHGSDSGKGRLETEGTRLRQQTNVCGGIKIINMDEPGGGTSREESRDVIVPALAELAANQEYVVVICHDYEMIPALVNAGLAKAVMPRLNEHGEPTFEIVSEIPTSSGGSKVLEMTSLATAEAIKRLRAAGGNEQLYWRFQRLHE